MGRTRSMVRWPRAMGHPAALVVEFLEDHFVRMACGGPILNTAGICKYSPTLAAVRLAAEKMIRIYIPACKERGFLHRWLDHILLVSSCRLIRAAAVCLIQVY
jgi:hypothetical protein